MREEPEPSKKYSSGCGFVAQCFICHKIGYVMIPNEFLNENSIKEMRKLENDRGLEFTCPECATLDVDFENHLEDLPKWVEVLQNNDKDLVFISKDIIVGLPSEDKTMKESDFLVKYRGFKRVKK